MLGNSYVVVNGLNNGEEIVTQGAFSVDASAQLEGKPSMMNQSNNSAGDSKSPAESVSHLLSKTFKVSGNCDMCKERIENAAKAVKGVSNAVWDVNTKIISVSYDDKLTGIDLIQKEIANAGHDNDKYKASDAVYKQLPECCLYRK